MRILVTGATGFIGAHLVKSLNTKGHDVVCLCRSEEKAKKLPPGVSLIKGDITDEQSLRLAMQDCEYVYHLAAYAKVFAWDSGTFYDINVRATNTLLDIASEYGVKRVVVVSTAGIYGASFDDIIDESYVRKKDFFNEYEGSKALSESFIKDYVIQGLDVVIVNPTRVYGPYLIGEPDSVTLLVKKYINRKWRYLPGKEHLIGNYVYVGDVVQGMELAMEKGTKGRTYILGGENHSYGDFFRILAEISGVKVKMLRMPLFISYSIAMLSYAGAKLFNIYPLITPKWIAKAKYNWTVSSARAEKELGYKITSLEDGLRITIDSVRV